MSLVSELTIQRRVDFFFCTLTSVDLCFVFGTAYCRRVAEMNLELKTNSSLLLRELYGQAHQQMLRNNGVKETDCTKLLKKSF